MGAPIRVLGCPGEFLGGREELSPLREIGGAQGPY